MDFNKIFHPIKTLKENLKDEYQTKLNNALIEQREWLVLRDNDKTPKVAIGDEWDYSYVYESSSAGQNLLPQLYVPTGAVNELSKTIKKKVLLREGDWTILGVGGSEDAERVQSTQDLWNLQDAAFNKCHTDPHIKNIAENIKYFTIGRGMKFEAANEDVQNVLLNFWAMNNMNIKQKEMVRSAYIEGEYFIVYFAHPDGTIKWRKIRCKEITDIESHPEDPEVILSYKREFYLNNKINTKYYPDINYDIQKDDELDGQFSNFESDFEEDAFAQFIKYGEENEKRGRVPMDSILKWSKLYKDWLYDRARLNHERSKVVWIKEFKDLGTDSQSTQVMRSPKGGMMLIETAKVKYRIENPQINADDVKEDGNSLLYMIGAGVNFPIHILDQRADQAVYSSLKKSSTPFSQRIADNQDFWADNFDKMFRFVLRKNIDAKNIPNKVKVPKFTSARKLEEIYHTINEMIADNKSDKEIVEMVKPMVEGKQKEISVPTETVFITKIFPEVIREDPFDQARVLALHREMGIASTQTLSEKAGYNWQEELFRMSLNKDNEANKEFTKVKDALMDKKGHEGKDRYATH